MKNKRFLERFGDIDERYVDEASRENSKEIINEYKRKKREERRKKFRFAGLIATGIAFVSVSLWLFIPFRTTPKPVRGFSDSPYYSVVQKLNAVTFKKPKYKNNFEWLMDLIIIKPKYDASEPPANGENGSYQETTDNQVNGVIEADIVKRTDKYIFYYSNEKQTLDVYTIAGEDSERVTSYSIHIKEVGYYNSYAYGEMFLSADGNTVTVIRCYTIFNSKASYKSRHYYEIVSLDVSDINNITENGRIVLSGMYKTARSVDGKLLFVSDFTVLNGVDFNNEEDFLPTISVGNQKNLISMEDIYSPDSLTNSNYTVLLKVDEKDFTVDGVKAFLSYSETVYATSDYVYLNREFTEDYKTDSKGVFVEITKTEIIPVYYGGEEFLVKDSVTIDGEVRNQYSLDEYEGNLRVVTTTREREYKDDYNWNLGGSNTIKNTINANLYVINPTSAKIIAQLKNFAPSGETVMSVRFDKDMAYVCTAIEVTLVDPVFFIDLSNLNDIKIIDSGVIAGFSSSLVNFGDGLLLGIGVNEYRELKIEVYVGGESGVDSVCKYELQTGNFSSNYKAYFIDRGNKLVGLAVAYYDWNSTRKWIYEYKLLKYENGVMKEIEIKYDEQLSSYDFARGILIGEYFYVVHSFGISVSQIEL